MFIERRVLPDTTGLGNKMKSKEAHATHVVLKIDGLVYGRSDDYCTPLAIER